MTPNEYLSKFFTGFFADEGSQARKIQEKFFNEFINAFNLHQFDNLDSLVSDYVNQVRDYEPMSLPITSGEYASKMNICISTARRRLKKMDHVICNSRNKPFIYRVSK